MATTTKTKRRSPKQASIYQKEIKIKLTGSNKKDLQAVAHAIHSMGHPLTTGGASKRSVHVSHISTEPTKIFDGLIKK
ncbi:MAG: hypothetical protein ACOC2U_03330 [bacterium]